MIGGLSKSISRAALFAAAGLFVGGVAMPSAKAADLGGDCCADLEERVAELEATTARKGNRKVSLTVYGWVNKGVLYWNDGGDSNTYLGVDNTNYATRFGLRGDARINPNLKAGFNILMDVVTGPTTSSLNQNREDNLLAVVNAAGTAIGSPSTWQDDHIIRMRDANVWLEHNALGRLTVGHLTSAGGQGIIDLGGVGMASVAAIDLVGGAFLFRNSATGLLTTTTIALNTTNTADFAHRTDGLRWDSPTIGGFVLGASIGETLNADRSVNPTYDFTNGNGPLGTYWAVNLRYAGEFAGFRVAAAAAYEVSDADERAGSSSSLGPIANDSTTTNFSASILHTGSGLFLQGSYLRFERPDLVASGGGTDTGTLWHLQGGIAKNWTGLGNTALYGEYARGEDLEATFRNNQQLSAATANTYDMWGLGVVQNIDAAAMEIYLAYRNHSIDRTSGGVEVDDIQTVIGGMRIGF
jgi:hypothetical protein